MWSCHMLTVRPMVHSTAEDFLIGKLATISKKKSDFLLINLIINLLFLFLVSCLISSNTLLKLSTCQYNSKTCLIKKYVLQK